jgi:hypothetical protein
MPIRGREGKTMSTPDTQEKSYFLTHIHKENSESLQGPEAHADFAS